MRFRWVLSAAVVTLVAAQARASMVFTSILSGDNERPAAVSGPGVGSATAMLEGDSGSYVLSYTLNYAGLSSDAVAGHIHYAIFPAGQNPAEQTGPVVHPLDADFASLGTSGTITGQWRFDDTQMPLTDALADSLLDGELYFNIHSTNYADGEIRGQLEALGGAADNAGPTASAIPLPPALVLGLAGLGGAVWATRRRRAITG
jgi:hypothetical protein